MAGSASAGTEDARTDGQALHGQRAEDLRLQDAYRGKINDECRDWKGRQTTVPMTEYLNRL